MKNPFYLFGSLLIMLACFCGSKGHAQTAEKGRSGQVDQWVSHQMNQPLPDDGKKFKLSQDIIDEIRRLYLQAKKEQEAKVEKQQPNPDEKQDPSKNQ